MDRRLISPKRDRRHLGGEPNIHGHLVSGLPSRIPDLARSPCTPCLGGIRLLSAPVSDPGLGRKAPPGAFCCTCRRFCYDLLYLQAPFCCACTRLFEFLLYLQALFCCTYRRLFAVPARAFGHGSAALAFTHENENKREEHGSPESSRPRRAARRRPTSRPFQLAAPGDGGHGWPVPYPYARAGQAPADLRQSWPTGRTWPLASALARPSVPDLDVRAPSDEPSRWTLG